MESNFDFIKEKPGYRETYRAEGLSQKETDLAYVSARKALEYFLDEMYKSDLWANEENFTLENRIKKLYNKKIIPKIDSDKYHQIREAGNDGSHGITLEKELSPIDVIKNLYSITKDYNRALFNSNYVQAFDENLYNKFSQSFVLDEGILNELKEAKEREKQKDKLIEQQAKEILELNEKLKHNEQVLVESNDEVIYLNVGITETFKKIWGRVFVNFTIDDKNYFAVRYWQPDWEGNKKAKEHNLIGKGKFENSPAYQLFPLKYNEFKLGEVLERKVDDRFDMMSSKFMHLRNNYSQSPSESLKKLVDFISNKHGEIESSGNSVTGNKHTLSDELKRNIMNFSGYFSAGAIEYGTDGPEEENGEIYLSTYHYLQFKGENPRNYDSFKTGAALIKKAREIKKCKYKSQNFEIKKFSFELLEAEKNNFIKR